MPYLMQKAANGTLLKKWDVGDKPLSVGRGKGVDVVLDDPEVSQQHFRISPVGQTYVIQDLKSKNGTFVNGKIITETALQPNDRIRTGNSHFVFVDGLRTVVRKLEKEDRSLSTYIRKM